MQTAPTAAGVGSLPIACAWCGVGVGRSDGAIDADGAALGSRDGIDDGVVVVAPDGTGIVGELIVGDEVGLVEGVRDGARVGADDGT